MKQHGSVPEEKEPAVMAPFQTSIPARLDRLPWSRFHWVIVLALGITWILDGLEVTSLTNPKCNPFPPDTHFTGIIFLDTFSGVS